MMLFIKRIFQISRSLTLILLLLIFAFQSNGQQLKGSVVDSITLEPLPYVNVRVLGSLRGSLTNSKGQFEIDLSDFNKEEDSLEISQLSYKTRRLALNSLSDSIYIQLQTDHFTLNEVVVSPQPPEEYIKEAIKRIPDNYVNQPYNTRVYFREVITLNGKYLNRTEAIMNAYNLPITYKGEDTSRLQLIALRHFNEEDEAVGTVKIKKKKKKQDRIDSTIIASVNAMTRDNGPYMILDSSLERRWYFAEEEKVLGDYNFRFKKIMPYENRKLLHIGYGDKKREEKDRENGYVYLEENSLAIESYMYQYDNIPAKIKAALFVFGYDLDKLELKIISTSQPTDSGYISEKAILRATVGAEKMKLFGENIPIKMVIEAVMIVLDHEIPYKSLCNDGIIIQKGKSLYRQAEPNPNHPIWDRYKGVITPEGTNF